MAKLSSVILPPTSTKDDAADLKSWRAAVAET
jgi:hypothetical protein